MNKNKRLAIHFYGFMRTFKDTYNSFKSNILEVNQQDYEVDIFIHTWDTYNSLDTSKESFDLWHKDLDYYPTMNEKFLSDNDKNDILNFYKPKKMLIEKLEDGVYGRYITSSKVVQLRKEYEKENNFKYDAFLYLRPDLMFKTPLRILGYINYWKDNPILDTKIVWCAHSSFSRMAIADPRVVTECDIIFFTKFDIEIKEMIENCSLNMKLNEWLYVAIDYLINRDFRIWREKYVNHRASELIYIRKSVLDGKIITLTNEIQNLRNEKEILQDKLDSIPVKKQHLELANLEQDLVIKKLESKKLAKSLGIKMNVINPKITFIQSNSAKARIQNHLSYKLGQALIENSKSILGYIRMPYVLSYIKDKHQKERLSYETKIKENPNLALPSLETYPDYNEALKNKECFTYKLGEAFIKAHKNWYKGGYIRFYFKDVPSLKKLYKK